MNLSKTLTGMAMLAILAASSSCSTNKTTSKSLINKQVSIGDNSQNALDFDGIYQGTIPCADCSGIRTVVYLTRKNTFKIEQEYLTDKKQSPLTYTGSFTWDKLGSVITLKSDQKDPATFRFMVGENQLFWLDGDGRRITGELADNFVLTKDNFRLQDKKWTVLEVFGKRISPNAGNGQNYLMFDSRTKRYSASIGCNIFNGNYSLKMGNQLNILAGVSTMMACSGNIDEASLVKVLQETSSFSLVANNLQLQNSKGETIATLSRPLH